MSGPIKKVKRQESYGANDDTFVYIAPSAAVTGEVKLGEDVNIWFGASIRGDEAPIAIGDGTNIQDNAVLHCDPGIPLKIGSYVTIGHCAVVHCSEVGDRTIVGMGAVLLAGAKIGEDSLVAAGSVVTPGKSFPPRSLIMGAPAKVVRGLTDDEVSALAESALHYIQHSHSAVTARVYGENNVH